jgi:hypothetical protein
MVPAYYLHSLFRNLLGVTAAAHELSHGSVFRASHMLHHQLTVYQGRAFALFMKVNVLHALGRGDADCFFWNPLLPKDDPRRGATCR